MSIRQADRSLLAVAGEETLWRDPAADLTLVARSTPSTALVGQIGQIRFGTHGLRYRRLDVAPELDALGDAAFLELHRGAELVGTYVLTGSTLEAGGRRVEGVHRGLLTVSEARQGQGLGRILVEQALRWIAGRSEERALPALTYGCIERRNARSLQLLSALGCRELGAVRTFGVYRQSPRARLVLETLDADDAVVLDALEEGLGDCALRATAPAAPFLAVTDDACVLAGASVSEHSIDLDPLGGTLGLLDRAVMRHVPAARRRFDPKRFTYLRIDDVVVRPGHARLWPALLTSLLASRGLHVAMLILDPRSRACALLRDEGLFGLTARAMHQEIAVLAAGWNLGDALEQVARRPLAVGPAGI